MFRINITIFLRWHNKLDNLSANPFLKLSEVGKIPRKFDYLNTGVCQFVHPASLVKSIEDHGEPRVDSL